MKLGFGLPVCGAWAVPDIQLAVARRAEELGFHELWTIQRLLYAHAPRDEYYGNPGPEWPAPFRSVTDPVVSLAFVASATERIRLGCAVFNAPFTNPVLFAKQVATLDVVSRGRLDVGVGLGWSRDEYTATGAAWPGRGARFDEFLDCVVAAWTRDEFEHRGTYFEVPRCSMAPRPVQRPHPPILVGGHSDAALRRAVRIGQGYVTGNLALDAVAPLLDRLGAMAESVQRDPSELRLVGRGSTTLAPALDDTGGRRPLTGTPAQIVDGVHAYAEAGYDELFLDLNLDEDFATVDADPARCLDTALELMERVAPLVPASWDAPVAPTRPTR
jgi:probable F420-dependent oxidoreductase